VEARSFSDGHVFVYGSYDLPGDRFYCSREYHAFSASDLITWRHHGRSFSTQADAGTGAPLSEEWRNQTLFAPDCIFHNGRYHLFFCTASNGEGVARSAAPEGPFSDPQPVAGAIEIRLDDPDGELIGTCTVRPTGSWSQLARSSCRITPAGCLTWVR
jgi:arabinoxylan arabinofuranohydrolase